MLFYFHPKNRLSCILHEDFSMQCQCSTFLVTFIHSRHFCVWQTKSSVYFRWFCCLSLYSEASEGERCLFNTCSPLLLFDSLVQSSYLFCCLACNVLLFECKKDSWRNIQAKSAGKIERSETRPFSYFHEDFSTQRDSFLLPSFFLPILLPTGHDAHHHRQSDRDLHTGLERRVKDKNPHVHVQVSRQILQEKDLRRETEETSWKLRKRTTAGKTRRVESSKIVSSLVLLLSRSQELEGYFEPFVGRLFLDSLTSVFHPSYLQNCLLSTCCKYDEYSILLFHLLLEWNSRMIWHLHPQVPLTWNEFRRMIWRCLSFPLMCMIRFHFISILFLCIRTDSLYSSDFEHDSQLEDRQLFPLEHGPISAYLHE